MTSERFLDQFQRFFAAHPTVDDIAEEIDHRPGAVVTRVGANEVESGLEQIGATVNIGDGIQYGWTVQDFFCSSFILRRLARQGPNHRESATTSATRTQAKMNITLTVVSDISIIWSAPMSVPWSQEARPVLH